ncbi:MAG: hypothetical protein IAE67_08465 [Candidatus Competibacteraceae bacterium]|nr:hypothetical protein [Candidatus Competibacteraceae bacterium]
MKTFRIILITLLTAFGLLSVILTSGVLLDLFQLHGEDANNVQFIVITNLICGVLYIIAAYGYNRNEPWTYKLLAFITLVLVLAFVALQIHIGRGGLYEEETIRAMIFRMVFSSIMTLSTYITLKRKKHE